MKIASILAAALIASVATAASAEVVETSSSGFRLRSVAVLETATPEQAWAALGRWDDWWDPAHTYSGNSANLALNVAAKLAAGVVWVNATNLFDAAAGFGGKRESGFGREGGKYSMDEMTEVKWITIQMGQRQFPF